MAIIDNGADRIRSKFRNMIDQGEAFVADMEGGSQEPLPWWMVSDPHGTQMASLISQANRFCRLYIARVGKRRDDIEPDAAAKAIRWAIKRKVDVISISWTMNRESTELHKAISEATDKHILIFCSTPDQGMYSDAWPANDKNVISVSATDQYGHLTSQATGTIPADIRIPGQNVPVKMGTETQSISGSSVATALAAGIASLALLLLRIFNDNLPDSELKEGKGHKYYKREGILEVFRKMEDGKSKAIKLSKMFPEELADVEKFRESLKENWCISNWQDK